ncbi:MAG TPA: flavodoxin [Candidatus Agathobaculum merdigallinarum]|nr:flavodoxin [Candidatus Agathobaculum merdigallinarum]
MKVILKRLCGLLMAATMLFGLAACGQTSQTAEQPQEPAETDQTAEAASTDETEPTDTAAGGSVLVAYFSATGNTEAAAGYIADALGADTFAITPAEPYSSDDLNWSDENSRVSREHEDPALQTVALAETTPENWEDYDTVFIGYPIWWGVAAWPVSSFVEANDFTGKTVIPFCTSSSSSLGESGTLLEQVAGTGEWLEGQRFSGGVSEETVAAWVSELDI